MGIKALRIVTAHFANRVALLCAFVLAGCAGGPSDWAIETETRLQCSMSIADAEDVAGRPLRSVEASSEHSWVTHRFDGDGGMDSIDLGFDDTGLRYVQTGWVYPMMTYAARYPKIDLCTPGRPSVPAVQRLAVP